MVTLQEILFVFCAGGPGHAAFAQDTNYNTQILATVGSDNSFYSALTVLFGDAWPALKALDAEHSGHAGYTGSEGTDAQDIDISFDSGYVSYIMVTFVNGYQKRFFELELPGNSAYRATVLSYLGSTAYAKLLSLDPVPDPDE